MTQNTTRKDFQATNVQTLEGEVIFGKINMGAFLCQNIVQAQGIVHSLGLEISAQELLARHTALRDTGIDLSYSCNLITPYREIVTLYITHETYEQIWQIWENTEYNPIEEQRRTAYVRAVASKVLPGIWVAEGAVDIHVQAGWLHCLHMHYAVQVSPEELYHEEFLVKLRKALDDTSTCNIHKISVQGEDIPCHSANESPGQQSPACTLFTTRTFDEDLHILPSDVQENIFEKLRALFPESTRSSCSVEVFTGFWGILRVTMMDAYWILYVVSTEAKKTHLYFLRICPVESILKKAAGKR